MRVLLEAMWQVSVHPRGLSVPLDGARGCWHLSPSLDFPPSLFFLFVFFFFSFFPMFLEHGLMFSQVRVGVSRCS